MRGTIWRLCWALEETCSSHHSQHEAERSGSDHTLFTLRQRTCALRSFAQQHWAYRKRSAYHVSHEQRGLASRCLTRQPRTQHICGGMLMDLVFPSCRRWLASCLLGLHLLLLLNASILSLHSFRTPAAIGFPSLSRFFTVCACRFVRRKMHMLSLLLDEIWMTTYLGSLSMVSCIINPQSAKRWSVYVVPSSTLKTFAIGISDEEAFE